jgi:hypothetical protein
MKRKYTVLCLALAAYIGSYVALSLSGAYMPATYGTNGIKDWAWTPRGFADDSGHLRASVVIPFSHSIGSMHDTGTVIGPD